MEEMKTPGTLLREAREARGLSLRDVAAATRVPRRMLNHIERDRFEEYTAEVFLRGHLRNFAREVRLDPEAVLQAYERHTGRQHVASTPEELKRETPTRPRATRAPTRKAQAPTRKPQAPTRKPRARTSFHLDLPDLFQRVRPTHMVAVALVIFGLFVMVSFLSSTRATAKDPASFPKTSRKEWEIEQDVKKTHWLLDQTPNPSKDKQASNSAAY